MQKEYGVRILVDATEAPANIGRFSVSLLFGRDLAQERDVKNVYVVGQTEDAGDVLVLHSLAKILLYIYIYTYMHVYMYTYIHNIYI